MASEITVRPVRWTPRGEAEVLSDGRLPLRVWAGIPGEKADVRLTHTGQHTAHAVWWESDEPDPHRVSPVCKKFRPCGGCPLMHVDAEGQAAAHRALVRRALDEHDLRDVSLGSYYESPDGSEDFRHIVKLGIDRNERGKLRVGGWGRRDRMIVPIPMCHVAAPVLRKAMKSIAHHIIDLDIEPYDPRTDRGVLRSVVLRASRTTGEVLVVIVAGRRPGVLDELTERIVQGVSEIVGVWLHVNSESGNAIFSRNELGVIRVRRLEGKDHIRDDLGGITYQIGPGDFFQTNPSMAELLYRKGLDVLEVGAQDTFVDLYCGVGGWALQAAARGAYAVGVEEVDGAVARAREAARQNKLTAEFISEQVEVAIPDLARRFTTQRPTVLVNPARRGLEDGVAELLLKLNPRQIGYGSCNPAAMARDLAELRGLGMEIGSVDMFAMFPNTPHVECFVRVRAPDFDAPQKRAPRRRVAR